MGITCFLLATQFLSPVFIVAQEINHNDEKVEEVELLEEVKIDNELNDDNNLIDGEKGNNQEITDSQTTESNQMPEGAYNQSQEKEVFGTESSEVEEPSSGTGVLQGEERASDGYITLNLRAATVPKGQSWSPELNFVDASDILGNSYHWGDSQLKMVSNNVDTSKIGQYTVEISLTAMDLFNVQHIVTETATVNVVQTTPDYDYSKTSLTNYVEWGTGTVSAYLDKNYPGNIAITWYLDGQKQPSTSDSIQVGGFRDDNVHELYADVNGTTLGTIYIIPERFVTSNQNDSSKTIGIGDGISNSSFKGDYHPVDLEIPETVYRFNAGSPVAYTVKNIFYNAFNNDSVMKSVTFSDSLDDIAEIAFGNTTLTTIKYISSKTKVHENTFVSTSARISNIYTDDPAVFAANVPNNVFMNYGSSNVFLWKVGETDIDVKYTTNTQLDQTNIPYGADLTFGMEATYPDSTYVRQHNGSTPYTVFEKANDYFKNATNFMTYHSISWMKDDGTGNGEVSRMTTDNGGRTGKMTATTHLDDGTYWATLDGNRIEPSKEIKIKVNTQTEIKVTLPTSMMFHSTYSSQYEDIESEAYEFSNSSPFDLDIEISDVQSERNIEYIEELSLGTVSLIKQGKVDFQQEKLVTLDANSGKEQVKISGKAMGLDGSGLLEVKPEFEIVLRFIPNY